MARAPLSLCELPHEQEELIRDVLARVSGEWVLQVLYELANADGPMRFTRVLEAVAGITQKVLTQALRSLERDGFVTRTVFAQVPPRVEYALTPLGRALVDQVNPVVVWTRRNVPAFEAARKRFDRAQK